MGNNHKQKDITITPIVTLPKGLDRLATLAQAEGFRFLDRLVADFNTGANTFSASGEVLLEARKGAALVGIAGLNQDPYVDDQLVGRVRRVYVDPNYRRQGVANLLMRAIEQAAEGSFSTLRLRTDTASGALFYEALGYQALVDDNNASHVKKLIWS